MERADLQDDETVFTRTGEFADRDAFTAAGWCAMERSLEVVGTRSAMMLVREAFYGGRRFDDLVRRTGLAETVASKRLRQLVADGLMERQPYRVPGARTRHEYVLTDRGRALFPLFVALMNWGRQADGVQGGVELVHADCGELLVPAVRCEAGHDVPIDETEARLARFHPTADEQSRQVVQGRKR
ncbi:helix-turn-helix domain-containing protein [Streptomyces sp. NPDC005803]|uniref:winged helix-turn-helix transcriptional regulator n=1 Tax=Streptomyces sp. NPDC005803 TaxID=3154297 RepID=UPI0033F01513